MKKLLIFGPANSPHLLNWALPLKEMYNDIYEVKILTFHLPALGMDYKGIDVQYIKPMTGTKLDYFFQLGEVQKLIKAYAPDVIHAHYASSYGFISTTISYQCKKILTVWGSDVLHARKNFFLKALIDRSLKKFAWINVPSLELSAILQKIGIPKSKILVFQYGIDLEVFDQYKEPKGDSGEIVILSSRNWASLYNINLIIDGFKIAYEKNKKLTLRLVGSGSDEESQLIQNKVSGHVGIQIIGKLPRVELIKELWKAHMFISIPVSDGMSLSVLEALYAECFPVLSNIPPNIEILTGGEGLLVKSFSSEEVGATILKAASSYNTSDLSKNKFIVSDKANYKKNIATIESKYRES